MQSIFTLSLLSVLETHFLDEHAPYYKLLGTLRCEDGNDDANGKEQ